MSPRRPAGIAAGEGVALRPGPAPETATVPAGLAGGVPGGTDQAAS